jgi:hypothetical protein
MALKNDTGTAIARQSSLKFVMEYLQMVNMPIGLSEITGISELITEYVINGRTPEVRERLKSFDNYLTENAVESVVDKLSFEFNGHQS